MWWNRPRSVTGIREFPAWLMGVVPVASLIALVAIFLVYGPAGVFRPDVPPLEDLSVQRIVLKVEPREIIVNVVNGGPEPVTIAQALVNDAYWTHTVEPDRTISRLGRAKVSIPYPWVEGDSYEVSLLSSTGAAFPAEIEVATQTPVVNARYLTTFSLLGIYAGVIPVFLGLFWLPLIRRLASRWVNFLLAFAAGLLLFLGVDAVVEALEIATERVSEAFQGISIVLIGTLAAFLLLMVLSPREADGSRKAASHRLLLAYLIAVSIGFHNLGEGLAIGTAYTLGNVALGSLLVVGFTVHNATEGLAIVSPVSRDRTRLFHFVIMGTLAGVPTIFGTWIGGFIDVPELSAFFLAVGAGAIFLVIYLVGRLILRESDERPGRRLLVAGFLSGLIVMYLTGLLVVA